VNGPIRLPDPAKLAEARAIEAGERARVGIRPGLQPRFTKSAKVLAIVDEEKSRAVQVAHSTYIFRPNQKLKTEHLVNMAKHFGVALRYPAEAKAPKK